MELDAMQYTKIITTEDGGSTMQIESQDLSSVEYMPGRPSIDLSEAVVAQSARFARAPAGWVGDWHPVPRYQIVIGLSGNMEFETTDGQRCQIGAGDVIHFEDVEGKGHFSKVTGDEAWSSVVIALD